MSYPCEQTLRKDCLGSFFTLLCSSLTDFLLCRFLFFSLVLGVEGLGFGRVLPLFLEALLLIWL